MGIRIAFEGRPGVVGTDRVPPIAKTADVLRKNPRADMRVETRVQQLLPIDAIGGESPQPTTVDLHVTEIFRTVAVQVSGQGISARLNLGDRLQQRRCNAIARSRLLEAVGSA